MFLKIFALKSRVSVGNFWKVWQHAAFDKHFFISSFLLHLISISQLSRAMECFHIVGVDQDRQEQFLTVEISGSVYRVQSRSIEVC